MSRKKKKKVESKLISGTESNKNKGKKHGGLILTLSFVAPHIRAHLLIPRPIDDSCQNDHCTRGGEEEKRCHSHLSWKTILAVALFFVLFFVGSRETAEARGRNVRKRDEVDRGLFRYV